MGRKEGPSGVTRGLVQPPVRGCRGRGLGSSCAAGRPRPRRRRPRHRCPRCGAGRRSRPRPPRRAFLPDAQHPSEPEQRVVVLVPAVDSSLGRCPLRCAVRAGGRGHRRSDVGTMRVIRRRSNSRTSYPCGEALTHDSVPDCRGRPRQDRGQPVVGGLRVHR